MDGKIKFSASMPPNFSIIHWALLGYYWIWGISHHNAAPRVSGAWDPGARQGGIRALKVRVALGAEGSGFWFLVLGSQGSGSLGR